MRRPTRSTCASRPAARAGRDTGQDITTSTLTVAGIPADQVISDVNVNLRLTHTFDGDLILTLIAPDGTRVLLANQRGGSGENYGVDPNNPNAPTATTFDDQAATSIGDLALGPGAVHRLVPARGAAEHPQRPGAPTGTGRWRSMTRLGATSGPCWPGR
jgi:hypothetical protein